MKKISEEQTKAIAKQMREEAARQARRKNMMNRYFVEGVAIIATIVIFAGFIGMMSWVVQDRIAKYPHLGDGWIPKTEAQRRKEAEPKVYTGR